MIKCSACNTLGANMRKCTNCGKIWCGNCAMQGKGPHPKQRAANICPYCGKNGTVVPAR